MSVKSHLSWIMKGGARTQASLQQLGVDLRELQQKVNTLALAVDRLDGQVAAGLDSDAVRRLEMSVGEMREQLRTVTDDLGDRVGAVAQLLNSTR